MTERITADKPCLPSYPDEQRRELIGPLLKEVSRSFYLTLRVLPAEVRSQISLAYLLARASDTIADTDAVPQTQRIELLRELRDAGTVALAKVAENQSLPAERELLLRLGECLQALNVCARDDQQRIRELLHTIISGQIFDLERFPPGQLTALTNDAELDRYTYMVAGCVGEFWTKICQAHLPGLEKLNIEDGIRFGKGLQLVNVLRDIPKDLRIGRCYLPVNDPGILLEPENFPAIKDVYTKWLDLACEQLDAGWRYTMQIPVSQTRLRLACVWPIWIGLKTISRLRAGNPLDPARRIKVTRDEVYRVMAKSLVLVRFDAELDSAYRKLRQQATSSSVRL